VVGRCANCTHASTQQLIYAPDVTRLVTPGGQPKASQGAIQQCVRLRHFKGALTSLNGVRARQWSVCQGMSLNGVRVCHWTACHLATRHATSKEETKGRGGGQAQWLWQWRCSDRCVPGRVEQFCAHVGFRVRHRLFEHGCSVGSVRSVLIDEREKTRPWIATCGALPLGIVDFRTQLSVPVGVRCGTCVIARALCYVAVVCGVVCYVVVWCGAWCVVCGVVWRALWRMRDCTYVVLCYVMLCYVMLWCGVVCGVVWCGVVWCGVVWCGVVCGV
jgi:hypothetical protein